MVGTRRTVLTSEDLLAHSQAFQVFQKKQAIKRVTVESSAGGNEELSLSSLSNVHECGDSPSFSISSPKGTLTVLQTSSSSPEEELSLSSLSNVDHDHDHEGGESPSFWISGPKAKLTVLQTSSSSPEEENSLTQIYPQHQQKKGDWSLSTPGPKSSEDLEWDEAATRPTVLEDSEENEDDVASESSAAAQDNSSKGGGAAGRNINNQIAAGSGATSAASSLVDGGSKSKSPSVASDHHQHPPAPHQHQSTTLSKPRGKRCSVSNGSEGGRPSKKRKSIKLSLEQQKAVEEGTLAVKNSTLRQIDRPKGPPPTPTLVVQDSKLRQIDRPKGPHARKRKSSGTSTIDNIKIIDHSSSSIVPGHHTIHIIIQKPGTLGCSISGGCFLENARSGQTDCIFVKCLSEGHPDKESGIEFGDIFLDETASQLATLDQAKQLINKQQRPLDVYVLRNEQPPQLHPVSLLPPHPQIIPPQLAPPAGQNYQYPPTGPPYCQPSHHQHQPPHHCQLQQQQQQRQIEAFQYPPTGPPHHQPSHHQHQSPHHCQLQQQIEALQAKVASLEHQNKKLEGELQSHRCGNNVQATPQQILPESQPKALPNPLPETVLTVTPPPPPPKPTVESSESSGIDPKQSRLKAEAFLAEMKELNRRDVSRSVEVKIQEHYEWRAEKIMCLRDCCDISEDDMVARHTQPKRNPTSRVALQTWPERKPTSQVVPDTFPEL